MTAFMFTFIVVTGLACLAVPVVIAVVALLDRPRVRVLVHDRMEHIAAELRADRTADQSEDAWW
ncbi:hypothetical protein [Nonomuraea soli]|uniref:Uncharacterized protein n=1 Tax=Nonomuraea soli TaxID=1032476 RepID=A0A7W0CT26_9ACTN|nr:hypothetical protein [Nonomuraea soli]MBA2896645.1 hypothetical protein [Nonomuraea soli]